MHTDAQLYGTGINIAYYHTLFFVSLFSSGFELRYSTLVDKYFVHYSLQLLNTSNDLVIGQNFDYENLTTSFRFFLTWKETFSLVLSFKETSHLKERKWKSNGRSERLTPRSLKSPILDSIIKFDAATDVRRFQIPETYTARFLTSLN